MNSESDQQRLASLLEGTYLYPDNKKITECQNQLSIACKSNEFMSQLTKLIRESQNEMLIKSGIAYIKHFLGQIQFNSLDFIVSNEQKIEICKQVFELVHVQSLALKHKINLIDCLYLIVQLDYDNNIKKSLVLKMLELQQNEDFNSKTTVLIALQAFIKGLTKINEIKQLYESFQSYVCSLIQEQYSLFVSNSESVDLELMNLGVIVIKDFIKKFGDYNSNTVDNIMTNQQMIQLFYEVLVNLGYQKENQKIGIIQTIQSDINTIQNQINTIKMNILRSFQHMVEILENKQSSYEQFKVLFMLLSDYLLQSICSMLKQLNSHDKREQILENEIVEKCIVSSLGVLSQCCSITTFYQFYSENKKTIFVDIVLPLIMLSESEHELFNDNPSEFIKLSLDCVDKQQIPRYKTYSARLLEMMCDDIDGCSTYCTQFIIQLMILSIDKMKEVKMDMTKYTELIPFEKSIIFNQSNIVVLDCCLMVLAVLSYLLHQRSDLVDTLQQSLTIINDYLFSIGNDIIRTRLCMFISYYQDNLYKSQHDFNHYKTMIVYLLTQLGNKQQNQDSPIQKMALESIKCIFEDQSSETVIKLQCVINEVLQMLLNSIDKVEDHTYYDVIYSVFKIYQNQIGSDSLLLQNCLQLLINKIHQKMQENQQTGSKDQLIINKVWNILKLISEQQSLVINNYQIIEEISKSVIAYIRQPEKIEFDEDIMLFAHKLLENNKKVTPVLLDILKCSSLLANKYNSLCFQFEFINLMIHYGSIDELGMYVNGLIEMVFGIVFNQCDRVQESDKNTGLLLLHLIIQKFRLDSNQVQVIIEKMNGLLQNMKQFDNQFIKATIIGVYNNLLIFQYNLSLDYFSKNSQMDQLFILITDVDQHKQWYDHKYDRKVGVLAMISMINPSFYNQLSILFTSIIRLFKDTQNQKDNQPYVKKDIDDDDDDDDIDDDDDDIDDDDDDDYINGEYQFMNEKQEALHIQKSMVSCIEQMDQYGHFRKAFMEMKMNNGDRFMEVIRQMEVDRQQELKDILASQMIKLEDDQLVGRKIYKIKQKK